MRLIKILVFLLPIVTYAQWEPLDIPFTARYDDVFFINENLGWAVGGGNRRIYKTVDGGQTWELKFTSANVPDYLRSIEFANDNVGFVGSLTSHLYMTADGGDTWEEITSRVPFNKVYNGQTLTQIPGICGLSIPTENTIYGCGIWSGGPAYVIKSTDGGTTWITTDMSDRATQLVDIFFLNDSEGFVTGRANPTSDGGIIFHTKDGGQTWDVVHKTGTSGDYVWKIQTPDSLNFFGSIQSLPSTDNVRFLKSTNAGLNWNTLPVNNTKWNYIQMIGFKDPMNGWTGGTASSSNGGETALYQTSDGGLTWSRIPYGTAGTFNRFYMVSDEVIYMTGNQVYKYNPEFIPAGLPDASQIHDIKVSPNPASSFVNINVMLGRTSRTTVEIIDQSGRVIQTLFHGTAEVGSHDFSSTIQTPGLYFVILHSNEGLNYQKFVIN